MKYICCQPANEYYLWQVETIINNFTKNGINKNDIQILLSFDNNGISDKWNKIISKNQDVNFYFYSDTRDYLNYQPSIYFHLMKKHLYMFPELKDEVLFLHDSDIVFTKKVNFDSMCNDKNWYLSDTNSYINYDYIISKGLDVYEKMCDIIGIDYLIPKLMNNNSGGAQYIVKNTDYKFWDKVEQDSHKLYIYFCEQEPFYTKKHDGDFPIQKWTAGMWALLWNAWISGHSTIVDKRLDFGWSTNDISDVDKYSILHNSGVTGKENGLFYKGNYIDKLPYNEELNLDINKASIYYYNEVIEAGKNSAL